MNGWALNQQKYLQIQIWENQHCYRFRKNIVANNIYF